MAYEYDLKGNRKKVTDPDGLATEYTFDALDRLATAKVAGGGGDGADHACTMVPSAPTARAAPGEERPAQSTR